MTSSRPYLVRALYDWILDNGMTPHLLVDATHPGALVPPEFVEDGKIVLNISPSAVGSMAMGNREIRFHARFGGVPTTVAVPIQAVMGVFVRENGHGMFFPDEAPQEADEAPVEEERPSARPTKSRPSLKVVK